MCEKEFSNGWHIIGTPVLLDSNITLQSHINSGSNLNNGISELGKQVIEKMNYYGMMIDISHPSKEAIRQTIQHTKAPVIASHSSARNLSDHPRNLDDEQLKWVKENERNIMLYLSQREIGRLMPFFFTRLNI